METAHIIATTANLVAVVCNIILMVLLYRWYGSKNARERQDVEKIKRILLELGVSPDVFHKH